MGAAEEREGDVVYAPSTDTVVISRMSESSESELSTSTAAPGPLARAAAAGALATGSLLPGPATDESPESTAALAGAVGALATG